MKNYGEKWENRIEQEMMQKNDGRRKGIIWRFFSKISLYITINWPPGRPEKPQNQNIYSEGTFLFWHGEFDENERKLWKINNKLA